MSNEFLGYGAIKQLHRFPIDGKLHVFALSTLEFLVHLTQVERYIEMTMPQATWFSQEGRRITKLIETGLVQELYRMGTPGKKSYKGLRRTIRITAKGRQYALRAGRIVRGIVG